MNQRLFKFNYLILINWKKINFFLDVQKQIKNNKISLNVLKFFKMKRMSFLTEIKLTKKNFVVIIGIIIVLGGIFSLVWTNLNTQCGPTIFSPKTSGPNTDTICVVGPQLQYWNQYHRIYGGTDPYLFYIYGLIAIVIGLFLIYIGINPKQQNSLKAKTGGV